MKHILNYFSRWQNILALILVLLFVFVAIFAPQISPMDPDNPGFVKVVGRSSDYQPHPPSELAPLGTQPGQKSVFHALVWGTRGALSFGLLVAFFSAGIGILLGALAGYAGGIINRMIMRVTDAFLAFPLIAGVVFFQQVWRNAMQNPFRLGIFYDPAKNMFVNEAFATSPFRILIENVDPLMLSFILLSWMPYARLVNALVTEVKHTEYFHAARSVGVRPVRILFKHLLPNVVNPAIILAARDVGSVVLLQATFTFIGLGGNSVWGQILVTGRDWVIGPYGNLMTYWWVYLPATLAVILFGITWNLFGDGLGELLDPFSRRR